MRIRKPLSQAVLILVCLIAGHSTALSWLDPSQADVDSIPNIQDNQFAFYNGPSGQAEWYLNYGEKATIRIKGYDDLSALGWDLSAYKNKVIEEAELHLCLYGSSEVNSLVVSTINSDWEEGSKTGGNATSGDSCWRYKSFPDVDWTYPGSDFSTVTFGNFGTLVNFGYKHSDTFREYTKDGYRWVAMKLTPEVVYAMILDNPGLVVTDPRFGFINGNPVIYSSESGTAKQPRLLLKTSAATDTTPPEIIDEISVVPGEWNGEAVITFTAPANPGESRAFGYNIRYGIGIGDDFSSGIDVERWRIPRPGEPGSTDRVLLENLEPGQTYTIWVEPYDRFGNKAASSSVSVRLPDLESVPLFVDSEYSLPDPSGWDIRGVPGVLNYWASTELTKINPATGNRMEDGYTESGEDDYKKVNPVWDASANTIRLQGVRNQMIGFQLIVQRLVTDLTNVSLSITDLVGPGESSIETDKYIESFRLHYTTGSPSYPDPAIPLSAPFASSFNLPGVSNTDGFYQSIWTDVYVPKSVDAGVYVGSLELSADQLAEPVAITLVLEVKSPILPDTPTFFLDLNGYGNKWESDASRYQVFQTAHKHRMVPNTLPYGWSESWVSDRAPVLTGSGANRTISDWGDFAEKYGPFFDGSAFSHDHSEFPYYGPGENTAIANFYTTGFEGWPLSVSDPDYGYDGSGVGGVGFSNWKTLVDGSDADVQTFWLESPDVMDAFPDAFKNGSRNVWRQFAEYAQAHGWKTAFQFYLNNKRDYSGTHSLWTLEEQYVADDFRADAFFLGLARRGWDEAEAPDTALQLRIDTSSRWQENWGQLKGIANLRAQGDGKNWDYRHDRYRKYLEQQYEQRWWYGSGPARTDSLTDHADEFLMHWSHGMDGGLPYWDSYRSDWENATGENANLSLFISGSNVPGHGAFDGRIATIRMKAMRYGQQLVELLNLLGAQDGWNRTKVRRALSAGFGDNSGEGYDSFGGDEYSSMSIEDYYRLQSDLTATIERCMLAGDVNDSGGVDIADVIAGLQILTESYDGAIGVNGDIDHDGRLSMVDVIQILKKIQ